MNIFKLLPWHHLSSLMILVVIQTIVLLIEINGLFYAIPELVRIFTTTSEDIDLAMCIPPLLVLLLSAVMRFISTFNVIYYTENERKLLTTFFLSSKMKTGLSDFKRDEGYEHAKKTISEADQVVNLYLKNIAEFLTGLISVTICAYIFYNLAGFTLIVIITITIATIGFINILVKPALNKSSKRLIHANTMRFKIILDSYSFFKFFRANNLVNNQINDLQKCTGTFRNANLFSQLISQGLLNLIEIIGISIASIVLIFFRDDLPTVFEQLRNTNGIVEASIGVIVLMLRLKPAFNKIHVGLSRMTFGSEVNQQFISSLKTITKTNSFTPEDYGHVSEIIVEYTKKGPSLTDNHFKMSAKAGDICVLHGESGVGKTTLLDSLAGLYVDQSDVKITINATGTITSFNQLSGNNFYYCPQSPYVINGDLRENIFLGDETNSKKLQKIIEMLELQKLSDESSLAVANLSGGEKSRIDIARALLSRKDILMFDESFSSFNIAITRRILDYISQELKCVALIVSHDDALIKDPRHVACLIK